MTRFAGKAIVAATICTVCLAGAARHTSVLAAAPSPYGGTAAPIPGTIQAANYDIGGEGVAYHDTTAGNSGGAYRQDGVDIETCSEGGYDVGWIASGEWLNYSVNVGAAGSYTVEIRVASPSGGAMHIGFNTASNVWKTVTIPATGGWQVWTTVTVPVTLGAGSQLMTLLADTAGFNVGHMKVSSTSGGGSTSGSGPYSGTPVSLPGSLAAADFDNGGEGVAYHDSTAGNAGGAYRSTDVDIQASSEGGYNIGWTDAGEWLNYTVNVASAGSYTAQIRVASPYGGSLHLGFNKASNVWSSVSVPNTGGWQAWTTVSVPVTLGAGTQQVTILFDTGKTNLASIAVVGGNSVSPPSSSGSTITVAAGGDLQAAIDGAQPGQTILLAPGATYSGSFVLRAKGGTSDITIRSGAADSSLPGGGVRMTPAYASALARVQGGVAGMPAFTTEAAAQHYRLQFLEIVNTYAANQIVEFGGDGSQASLGEVPHHLTIDRCYIHGDPTNGQKRGIVINSAYTTIVNSYISDIKSSLSDSQAIAGWNGPGPFTIENNYLEAAGENFMLGGSDPAIPNLVPSDVSFRFNYVTKQTSWRGQGWTVKNLIELKNAQRVTIDSNVIEYSWAAAQQGYAIVLTPRNQGGTAPWSVVQHVQLTNNIVRHVASAINILGLDTTTYTVTNDITVRNNLFDDISVARWGGRGQLVLTVGGSNITIDHNTVFTDGASVVYADGPTVSGFVFTNNIVPDNAYAVMGSNASEGNGTLSMYYPGATFRRNVLVGGNSGMYPADNYFPASVSDVGFVDASGGNYRLSSSSPFNNLATDGTDIGCNIDALKPQ